MVGCSEENVSPQGVRFLGGRFIIQGRSLFRGHKYEGEGRKYASLNRTDEAGYRPSKLKLQGQSL